MSIEGQGAAFSKAQRRKRKKALTGKRALFALHQTVEDGMKPDRKDKPTETVMQARARRLGTTASLDLVTNDMLGDPCGEAIHLGVKPAVEARRVWDVFKRMDAADDAFCRRILGKRRFPAVSKMEFMPERLETGPNEPLDVRTEDEKIAAARDAQRSWQGLFDRLYQWQRLAIESAARGRETLHQSGALTAAGRSFVAAMQRLTDIERS